MEEMAAHMRRLHEEPKFSGRLGMVARAIVVERYDAYEVRVGQ